MHETQTFVDSNEPYVWIYDPTSTTTYIIGFLLILGSIGICLFPLWPSQVREGVYYLSLAGIALLGAILGLAAFKYILFGVLWTVTLGKLHFWLFPNLTEDVGFFESFVPVYKIDSPKQSKKTPPVTATEPDLLQKSVVSDENVNKTPMASSTIMTRSSAAKAPGTPSSSIKASAYELTKSTVEVTTVPSGVGANDSPYLLTKSVRNANGNDDEEFELLDDDEVKQDQN
jgi:hypothetical protein